jgi:hypothetical protein
MWSQWDKTRTQSKKEKKKKKLQKIFKHMETEHSVELPVGHWQHKERNQKVPRI